MLDREAMVSAHPRYPPRGATISAPPSGARSSLAPIRNPDIDELTHWIGLSGNRIRQITMAPEIDGALEFIAAAASRGVTVSIGHTDANAAQTEAGIAAGASHATHLFNAMRGLSHREPGTVGAACWHRPPSPAS